MIYLISAITALMLGYMVWLTVFRLRHDRVRTERHRTRGKHAFRPKERARYLLGRSFKLADDKPEWEDPLVASLAKLPVQPNADPTDGAKAPRNV